MKKLVAMASDRNTVFNFYHLLHQYKCFIGKSPVVMCMATQYVLCNLLPRYYTKEICTSNCVYHVLCCVAMVTASFHVSLNTCLTIAAVAGRIRTFVPTKSVRSAQSCLPPDEYILTTG